MGFRRTTASAKVFRIPVEISVTKGETMAMPAFDTHKAVKALSSAGFDNAQAEAVVDQISGAVSENVATKVDLERFATKVDLERFATKVDLERFATKEDLERFATKEDLERFATKEDLERFATKADLERFATKEHLERYATKEDLERFATKEDLRQEVEKLELRLAAELEKQSSKYLRSMVVVVAGIVGLSKALELLLA